MIALTEDLLERVGAAQATLPIETRPVDLVELAHRVAARFRPAAGRAISVSAAGSVSVPGDPIRLDRALSNLVDNAIRHGAGDVTIDVGATGRGAFVVVTDSGTGFSPDGDTIGLGLTIVREVVRAHGGTVEIHRLAERTAVRLDLPATLT